MYQINDYTALFEFIDNNYKVSLTTTEMQDLVTYICENSEKVDDNE